MKIIDLLNKIANGEEVPKYVQYYNILKGKTDIMMVCKENIFYKLDQLEIQLNSRIEPLEEKKTPTLNDIRESYGLSGIEEKKIPEKFDPCIGGIMSFESVENIFSIFRDEINEIIDYLKSKGE